MNQTVRQQKKELRRLFRTERSRLGRNERRRAEQAVIRHLKPLVRRGKKIAVYWAMGSELNLSALFQTASERGATVYLPYIEPDRKRMWFTPYCANAQAERKRGRSRLHVPQFAGRKVRADRLDVMLLPVVAADRRLLRCHPCALPFRTAAAHRCRFFLPAYRQPAARSTRYAAARFRVGTA